MIGADIKDSGKNDGNGGRLNKKGIPRKLDPGSFIGAVCFKTGCDIPDGTQDCSDKGKYHKKMSGTA